MADDREIERALIKAAMALVSRSLTEREQQKLIETFDKDTGTRREKATRAIGTSLGLSPREIRDKRASDDNADRIIKDVEDLLDD